MFGMLLNRGDKMIKQIGTKIYYCNLSGNVIKIIGDMQGYVKETTFDEDIEIYTELKERDINAIGLLQFNYGEYPKLSQNSTGVMVDLKTKELIFSYEELPTPPQEPTEIEIIQNKISILEAENEKLKVEQEQQNEEILVNMLANTEMFEIILGMMPMALSIEDKNTKNNGGSNMVEVYVTLIIKGVKTIEDVPLVIREQVIERLKQLEVPVK